MRILLLNRFYWPDESSTAMLLTDLAEDLAAAGHDVHVACARLLYDRTGGHLPKQETRNGVRIHRLPSMQLGRQKSWRRMADLASFHASLRIFGPRTCKPDVVFALTDPPMLITAARSIARAHRARLVHYVMDIYPEIAVQMGVMRADSAATRRLQIIYRTALNDCDLILSLGDRMTERLIEKGAPADRIVVAPPWAESSTTDAQSDNPSSIRSQLNLSTEAKLIMYAGNMGQAHTFGTLLECISQFRDSPNVHFVFVGDGSRRSEIESFAREMKLTNVHLLPYQPREAVPAMLAEADAHFITQDTRSVGLIVPSKFAGILAAGRPAIFIGDPNAEIAQWIVQFGCGIHTPENDPAQLESSIRSLLENEDTLKQTGKAARSAFEAEFSRSVIVSRIQSALMKLA